MKESTVLLLNFNDSNNSTTFIDETGKTITANGDVKISTTQSAFGGSSGYFDGTGDYLSFSSQGETWNFSRGDWTLECWVYPLDTVSRAIFMPRNSTFFPFGIYTSGNKIYAYGSGDTWNISIIGGSTLVTNDWNHVAFVRYGNLFLLFVNGVVDGSQVYSGNLMAFPVETLIGKDPGNYNSNWYGYIDSFRLIKGRALYTEAFTVPSEQPQYDPYYSLTSLLIPFDGPNNSTVFGDYSPNRNIITVYGDTKISTTQSKFGGSSGYFDGVGDYLEIPSSTLFDFGTWDFTIEAWIYPTSYSNYPTIFSRQDDTELAFQLRLSTGGNLQSILRQYGSGVVTLTSSTTVPLNQWSHVAIERYNGTITLYIDGINKSSGSNSYNLSSSDNENVHIGALQYAATSAVQFFNGYIDDLRVTNGGARYTGNFTPPNQAVYKPYNYDPYLDNVSLLLHMDGDNNSTTFKDNSSNDLTVTPNGNAKISTTQSKTGGASGYFDGSGDYLELPLSDSFDLSTGDFTIESWCYLTNGGSSAQYRFIVCNDDILATRGWRLIVNDSNQLSFSFNSGSTSYSVIDTNTFTLNTWLHVAVVRSGDNLLLFKDGTQVASTAVTGITFNYSNVQTLVGDSRQGTPTPLNHLWYGYIDELRITKGTARYTTDFTPPSYRFYDLVAEIQYFYGVYNELVICKSGESIGDYRNNSRIFIDNDLYFDIVDYGEINIQGYYKIDKTPVWRKILLCTYPNYFIIRETWSDPITGYYLFKNVKKQDYVLIFEDYENLHHSKIRRLFMDQM